MVTSWSAGQGKVSSLNFPRQKSQLAEMGEIKVRLQTSYEAPLNKIVAQPENLELFDYINSQIEAKEKELECPVCLEVAAAPIFSCEDQHIICSHCRPKVKRLSSKLC